MDGDTTYSEVISSPCSRHSLGISVLQILEEEFQNSYCILAHTFLPFFAESFSLHLQFWGKTPFAGPYKSLARPILARKCIFIPACMISISCFISYLLQARVMHICCSDFKIVRQPLSNTDSRTESWDWSPLQYMRLKKPSKEEWKWNRPVICWAVSMVLPLHWHWNLVAKQFFCCIIKQIISFVSLLFHKTTRWPNLWSSDEVI